MKSLQIIGKAKDLRTGTNIIYAQIEISEYLDLVGEDFDRFEIQRKREKHKAYNRMKQDLKNGALLPPITLAISPQIVKNFVPLIEQNKKVQLIKKLIKTNHIYILDGLQRTYIISDLNKDNIKFKKGQKILLEFWFESDIKHLIYRLIILNAGQKPMSMRHQVELLFMTAQDKLEKEIPELSIYKENDETRRTGPSQFPFDRIVTGYYSFLKKTPEVRRDNIVVKQMDEDDILFSQENDLADSFSRFEEYLKKYCVLDKQVFRVYQKSKILKGAKNWLVDENVINAFFAAIATFGNDAKKRKRINISINRLIFFLRKSSESEDPLDLKIYYELKSGLNPKKENVGFATRRLIMNGFKEFFREAGEISFAECWRLSVD